MVFLDTVLLAAPLLLLVCLPLRIWQITRLKIRDARFFFAFWFWPLAWYLMISLIPAWRVHEQLFPVAEFALIGGGALDFFYYFALRTERTRAQIFGGLIGLPPVLLILFASVGFKDTTALVLPHYDRALVWTDRAWRPTAWYFMDPGTRPPATDQPDYRDPNYSKAVFSPCAARIVGWHEQNHLQLEHASGLTLTVGPFLKESLRVEIGQDLVENQVLGLLDISGDHPGIRLEILSGGPIHFKDGFAGRWLARRQETFLPGRNQITQSDSKTRFRLNPDQTTSLNPR